MQPAGEVGSLDPERGPAGAEPFQPLGGLDLDVDVAGLDHAGGAVGEKHQVEAVVAMTRSTVPPPSSAWRSTWLTARSAMTCSCVRVLPWPGGLRLAMSPPCLG